MPRRRAWCSKRCVRCKRLAPRFRLTSSIKTLARFKKASRAPAELELAAPWAPRPRKWQTTCAAAARACASMTTTRIMTLSSRAATTTTTAACAGRQRPRCSPLGRAWATRRRTRRRRRVLLLVAQALPSGEHLGRCRPAQAAVVVVVAALLDSVIILVVVIEAHALAAAAQVVCHFLGRGAHGAANSSSAGAREAFLKRASVFMLLVSLNLGARRLQRTHRLLHQARRRGITAVPLKQPSHRCGLLQLSLARVSLSHKGSAAK